MTRQEAARVIASVRLDRTTTRLFFAQDPEHALVAAKLLAREASLIENLANLDQLLDGVDGIRITTSDRPTFTAWICS